MKDKKKLRIMGSISQENLKTSIGKSLMLKYLVYFCVNKNKLNKDSTIITLDCYISQLKIFLCS